MSDNTPEFEIVKDERTGELKEQPIKSTFDSTADDWFENDDDNSQESPTAIIYYLGREFHIRELSRRQNKSVDERLREIQKMSGKLRKLQRKVKAAETRREEPDEAINEQLARLSRELVEKKRENELIVVKRAVKKWNLSGTLEKPTPEDIDKLFRSRLTGLYDRIMQKSRLGSSEGDF